MTTIPSAQKHYRADIDGLRALAVAAVVLFHAFPSIVPGGFIGVDIFFVISGYLISGIILKELRGGRFTFLNFYARRIRRIVPALAIVLAATWIIGWYALLADDFRNVAEHLVAGSTFSSNILLLFQAGYFDLAAELKPLLHLWSLGIEEQFYLTWPVLLVLGHRRKWNISAIIGTSLLISFVFDLWQVRHNGEAAFYLLPARYWELMIGCGLAYYETNRAGSIAFASQAKSGAAAVLLIAGLFFIDRAAAYPSAWTLLPTCAAFLFISAGPEAWINKRILALEPAVLIGRISYPLYLWHWMLLSFARIMEEGTPSLSIRLSVIGLSFVLAWLTWRIVELPLQTRPFGILSSRERQKSFVLAGAAALAFLSGLGAATYMMNGFPSRYPRSELIREQTRAHELGTSDCLERYGLDIDKYAYCYRTDADPRVILWGDSHSDHLITGLTMDDGKRPGTPLIQFGKGDCPPLAGIERLAKGVPFGCLPVFQKARELVDKDFSEARIAVLSFQIPWDFADKAVDPRGIPWTFSSSLESDRGLSSRALFKAGLSRTVRFLESRGKSVVIFIDIPELDFDPMTCFDVQPMRITKKTPRACRVPRNEVESRQREYRAIISELRAQYPRLRVFDPIPYFCDADYCYAVKEGKLLYRDSNHLSVAGSVYIGKPLKDFLGFSPKEP